MSPMFEHAYPIIIKIAFRFPKCVSPCKKNSSFHQLILEIYIADFRVPWSKRLRPFLTSATQKQVTMNMTGPPLNIWLFCITIEHKSSWDTIFLIYCKNSTKFLFWVLWTCQATSIKTIMPTCRNFDVYLDAKTQLHRSLLSPDIAEK